MRMNLNYKIKENIIIGYIFCLVDICSNYKLFLIDRRPYKAKRSYKNTPKEAVTITVTDQ